MTHIHPFAEVKALAPRTAFDELETARLRLRAFTSRDLSALSAITADAETMKFIGDGKPLTVGETKFNLERIIESFHRRGFGRWALIDKALSELIGYCGFAACAPEIGIEIAYLIARPCWGRGFATEAARACLHYGFAELGLPSIAALTKPDNLRSRRLMERLGITYRRDELYFGYECVHYTIAKAEFPLGLPPYQLHRRTHHCHTSD